MPLKRKSTNLSTKQQLKIDSSREMEVFKRSDMIQKGRHTLSLQEQRCVLFAISKVKPDDKIFQEYPIELKELYRVCGIANESYTATKKMLLGLRAKTWLIETAPGELSTVSWFNKVRINKRTGTVIVRFDDDMMPYLLELSRENQYYTHYQLKYILAMRSQYAIQLYELLKSYQRNNIDWFFDLEELKKQLNCEKYTRFPDFRRYVLEQALREINTYSDIEVDYDTEKEGRRVSRIIFFMARKKKDALFEAEKAITEALDGQLPADGFAPVRKKHRNAKDEE